MEIASQPAFRAIGRDPFSTPASSSDADLIAFMRQHSQTVYHPTSTCAIGPVVDSRLSVHGISGLRVADASVMPTICRGNTNAATIMIGEKAAALIREDAFTTTGVSI